MTEKLMIYALGRGVDSRDMPAVRAVLRDAAKNDNRFSSIVLGIVRSVPFRMRTTPGATEESTRTADVGAASRRPAQ